jgi:hypothetical protein
MRSSTPSPLRAVPIESIWITAVHEAGWELTRTPDNYATTDGVGRILIGEDQVLDVDDALAQLVFHELCHALVQGPSSWAQPDWGLSNTDDQDIIAEHACLCLHALLASPFGLRELMAPTTEYRAYHDALTPQALASPTDAAARRAQAALELPGNARLVAIVKRALVLTAQTLANDATTSPAASAGPDALHPTGLAWGDERESCGTCAWLYRGGRGPAVARCRQSAEADGEGKRTDATYRACQRWEPPVDCQTCGACCREAYHSVTVSVRDPVVWKQPDLVVRHGHRFEIRREGPRCAALDDRRDAAVPGGPLFSCSIYDDRPRPCREFEANGRHCLVARRRVGLTP